MYLVSAPSDRAECKGQSCFGDMLVMMPVTASGTRGRMDSG